MYGASQVVLMVKKLPAKAGDMDSIPVWGRSHIMSLEQACFSFILACSPVPPPYPLMD